MFISQVCVYAQMDQFGRLQVGNHLQPGNSFMAACPHNALDTVIVIGVTREVTAWQLSTRTQSRSLET